MLSLEKGRLQSDPAVAFQYLKGGIKKDRETIFLQGHTVLRQEGMSSHKESRFRLGIRKKLFSVRLVRYRNTLSREAVG